MKRLLPLFIMAISATILLALITHHSSEAYVINYTWATNHASFKYHPSLPSAFQSGTNYGATVWTNVTTSSWYWIINDTSSNNDVRWGTIDGAGGLLAMMQPYTCGGTTLCQFYIKYDSAENWYTGSGTPGSGQKDLRSIAAHEFGHATGLGHTQPMPNCPGTSANATMCATYTTPTTYWRTLEGDDRNGLTINYP